MTSDPAALFHSLSDETRLRLLRLLHREELNVGELVGITGLSQPRISKHLAILREHGWLRQRKTGTWSWYRSVDAVDFAGGESFYRQALLAADQVLQADTDDRALAVVLAERQARDRDFFTGIADQWDRLRTAYDHPDIRVGAVSALVARPLEVVDIGTGTGALLPLYAGIAGTVVAVDQSQAMLARARAHCQDQDLAGVRFCAADICHLPFAAAQFDVCSCSMALHHVEQPAQALAEMARIVRPGGKVLVIAFAGHEMTWMRDELAHKWLGFSREDVQGFFAEAGLNFESLLVRPRLAAKETPLGANHSSGARWPDIFLAVGAKVAS